MEIAGIYSFNDGQAYIKAHCPHLLSEIEDVIHAVDPEKCKTKESLEKTMPGRILYNPKELNKCFTEEFSKRGWEKKKVECDYPTKYYTDKHKGKPLNKGAFREMDYMKEKLGIEVQFGKYAFMVYNVAAKMTIFHNLGFIDAGVEIVPIKELADEMSTGVSYFEQFIWDLEQRGVSNIDIPVLVIGVE